MKVLRKLVYIIGTIALMIALDGFLFYLLEWRHADMLLMAGFGMLSFLFAPLFAYYRFQNRK